MVIRPMQTRDVEHVADLMTQLGYPSTPDAIARRFTRIEGRADQALLVADSGTAVVGWMHIGALPYLECDESAEILGLVVAEGQRGHGIGTALVSAAETWASEQGCHVLRVRSRITRDRAHAFYERGGFQRIKTQHCFQKMLS
jgi:GNAT superfamily N-acetyltransferase